MESSEKFANPNGWPAFVPSSWVNLYVLPANKLNAGVVCTPLPTSIANLSPPELTTVTGYDIVDPSPGTELPEKLVIIKLTNSYRNV